MRALPFLRIYVGIVWLAYGTSKLTPDWAGGKHYFLAAVTDAAAGAGQPFRGLLTAFVIPHQAQFANLIAYGETLVGISLFLGVLTKIGALGGTFLSANYFFATGRYATRSGVESLELLLFVVCLYLFLTPSGARLGIDSLVRGRWGRRAIPQKTP